MFPLFEVWPGPVWKDTVESVVAGLQWAISRWWPRNTPQRSKEVRSHCYRQRKESESRGTSLHQARWGLPLLNLDLRVVSKDHYYSSGFLQQCYLPIDYPLLTFPALLVVLALAAKYIQNKLSRDHLQKLTRNHHLHSKMYSC